MLRRSLLLWSLCCACHSSVGAPTPSAKTTRAERAKSDVDGAIALQDGWDGPWDKRWLAKQSLTLNLPDATRWRRSGKGVSFAIEHPASSSELKLNLTRAERLVKPSDCEQRARLAWPELPRADDSTRVESRRIDAPSGYVTELEVVVVPLPGERAEGHVLAFGASVGRCLSFHFVTRAAGAGRFELLADRLGLVTGRMLPSITPRAADDRVQVQPLDR